MDYWSAILLVGLLLLLGWLCITIGYRFWLHRATLYNNQGIDDSATSEVLVQRLSIDANDTLGVNHDGSKKTPPEHPLEHPPEHLPEHPHTSPSDSATLPRHSVLTDLRASPDETTGIGRGALGIATTATSFPQSSLIVPFPQTRSASDSDQTIGNPDLAQQQVLSVLLLPPSGQSLDGNLTLAALASQQMLHSSDQFYHRYDNNSVLDGQLLFSAAQLEPPGSLSRSTLEDKMIPGIILFICLAQAVQPEAALSAMFQTAQSLAKRINAVVCDANSTRLTLQATNYMYQQINESTRLQLLVS